MLNNLIQEWRKKYNHFKIMIYFYYFFRVEEVDTQKVSCSIDAKVYKSEIKSG